MKHSGKKDGAAARTTKTKPVHQFLTFVGNEVVDRATVRHPNRGGTRFMGQAQETEAWKALPYEVAAPIAWKMRHIVVDRLEAIYGQKKKRIYLRLDREYISHPQDVSPFANYQSGDLGESFDSGEGIQPRL